MTDESPSIRIAGTEYVIVPKAEYLRLRRGAGIPAGNADAFDYVQRSIGEALRAAREKAKLTQVGLAKKLRKSQPLVAGAESGRVRVSERYVHAVLKACRLPEDWKPPRSRPKRAK
jgi:ribosome-binding protein aMBF1 (putative translation factor)